MPSRGSRVAWKTPHPSSNGPSTRHRWRSSSPRSRNSPLLVPTNARTPIAHLDSVDSRQPAGRSQSGQADSAASGGGVFPTSRRRGGLCLAANPLYDPQGRRVGVVEHLGICEGGGWCSVTVSQPTVVRSGSPLLLLTSAARGRAE